MTVGTVCSSHVQPTGSTYRESGSRAAQWLYALGRYIEERAQRRARAKAAKGAVPELSGLCSATLHDMGVRPEPRDTWASGLLGPSVYWRGWAG